MAESAGRSATPESLVDRALWLLERALAFLFIGAVALNFINVCGRYIFGHSILSAEEWQIFAMLMMTFLGCIVVSWRGQHLRMDVLVNAAPRRLRLAVQAAEIAVLIAVCGFVLYQSYRYAEQMYVLERTSDMAGIPMWISHGSVAVSFGLMLAIALWRGLRLIAGRGGEAPGEYPHKDAA
jgi:TRAP-type C4-dicarboxylate transport system permease small subunit